LSKGLNKLKLKWLPHILGRPIINPSTKSTTMHLSQFIRITNCSQRASPRFVQVLFYDTDDFYGMHLVSECSMVLPPTI